MATAFSSVRKIIMPAQGGPEEWPLVDPSNGGLSLSPLPGDVRAQSGRRWPRPRELRLLSNL